MRYQGVGVLLRQEKVVAILSTINGQLSMSGLGTVLAVRGWRVYPGPTTCFARSGSSNRSIIPSVLNAPRSPVVRPCSPQE